MGRLEGGDDAVKEKNQPSDDTQQKPLAVSEPQPNQIASPNLAKTGGNEEEHGLENGWEVHWVIAVIEF